MKHLNTYKAMTAVLVMLLCAGVAQAQNWEPMPSPVTTPLKGIWGTASNNIYAVGSSGVILHFDGTSWSRVTDIVLSENLSAVHGSSASNIVAVGENGVMVQYNGTSWTKRTVTASANLNAVWVVSPSQMFIAGENGVILTCDQTTCAQNNYFTSYSLNSIWAAAANDVYAVGGAGIILHFDGSNWSQVTSNTTNLLYGVWGASASQIFAVGENGTVQYFNGTAWSPMKVVKRDYYAVGGLAAPFRVYSASKDGKISYYEGSAWTDMNSGTTKALQAIWVSPTNEAFCVGAGGTILKYTGEVIPENTPPEAAFSVTVSTENPLTIYVDASESSDLQTSNDALEVQWDWEGDGTFDTQYSTTKIASHTYPAPGTYTITLRVRDQDGLTDTQSQQIVLTADSVEDQCPTRQLLGADEAAVALLCRFRDEVLARTTVGRALISSYYRHAPELSSVLAQHPNVAIGLRLALEAALPLCDTATKAR